MENMSFPQHIQYNKCLKSKHIMFLHEHRSRFKSCFKDIYLTGNNGHISGVFED
jgi:hypothetical protein